MGRMPNVSNPPGQTGQALARWIDENGYRPLGLLREVYLEVAGDQEN